MIILVDVKFSLLQKWQLRHFYLLTARRLPSSSLPFRRFRLIWIALPTPLWLWLWAQESCQLFSGQSLCRYLGPISIKWFCLKTTGFTDIACNDNSSWIIAFGPQATTLESIYCFNKSQYSSFSILAFETKNIVIKSSERIIRMYAVPRTTTSDSRTVSFG